MDLRLIESLHGDFTMLKKTNLRVGMNFTSYPAGDDSF